MSTEESRDERCAMPPAPSGVDLLAAADGEADEATLAHLRTCPACTARVAQLRALQAQLRRRLYRLHCPSSDLLIDYCQGLLDPYQRATLVHHLALCPHCMAEIALLERGTTQPDALIKTPRRLVAPAP
jgi:anti-sigma factor RsiW